MRVAGAITAEILINRRNPDLKQDLGGETEKETTPARASGRC